jgi:hypothetical protein
MVLTDHIIPDMTTASLFGIRVYAKQAAKSYLTTTNAKLFLMVQLS